MLAHLIGLLMSIFVCMYVGIFLVVCVEYIAEGGGEQYNQSEEEGLMSQSQSIRGATKNTEESTGHSLCFFL